MTYPNLDPIPVGDDIAAFCKNFASTNIPFGTAITDDMLKQLWEGIMNLMYIDLKANMGVKPGSFVVAGVQPGPSTIVVTGIGGPAE